MFLPNKHCFLECFIVFFFLNFCELNFRPGYVKCKHLSSPFFRYLFSDIIQACHTLMPCMAHLLQVKIEPINMLWLLGIFFTFMFIFGKVRMRRFDNPFAIFVLICWRPSLFYWQAKTSQNPVQSNGSWSRWGPSCLAHEHTCSKATAIHIFIRINIKLVFKSCQKRKKKHFIVKTQNIAEY